MTAVTAGLGLIPLVLSKGEPGKEILYPVPSSSSGGSSPARCWTSS
jgi:HME family heavy-metal exporter